MEKQCGMKKDDDSISVGASETPDGIAITFQGETYPIRYPEPYWESTPPLTRTALRDNLSVAVTMHLPLVYNSETIIYDTPRAMLFPYFFENFARDIPSCTEVDGTDTDEVMSQFFRTSYRFTNDSMSLPDDIPVPGAERAIIAMSFGKDSLLTYSIAHELELDPEIVYIVEESLTYEEKHKRALGEAWKKEFGKSMHILHHETGKLRNYEYLELPKSEFGWGLQSTEYALELLPFAYALAGKYILFGNEQTTSATYMDKDGRWIVYPCYDQSHEWTVQINQMTKRFSGGSTQTGSLIEPLMDIMVQRILVHRYPEFAKYQMSCFTETEAGKDYRWCQHCDVCAKMYLLCVASGVNPKDVGFTTNMLDGDRMHHFTLFGGFSDLTYANTPAARNEQLFAFYSATKKGAHGSLIDSFRESEFYSEAKEREEELYRMYTTIYDPISIPSELREEVLSIYREEVSSFEL